MVCDISYQSEREKKGKIRVSSYWLGERKELINYEAIEDA